ncbi:MAG TPA: L,D-transpeptidase [Gemmatimonadaceae bacterium]
MRHATRWFVLALSLSFAAAAPGHAQGGVLVSPGPVVGDPPAGGAPGGAQPAPYASVAPTAADSAASRRTREAAALDEGLRVVVSIDERRMWTLLGADTLLSASAAVGMDARLDYAGRSWIFRTPRGMRRVLRKYASAVWVPPDWHYAEVAAQHGFRLARLAADTPVTLADGRRLEVRNGEVGVEEAIGGFAPLPSDEEIVFDSTLFIPPYGTKNRRVTGELGAYQLDLGDGYLLHGTPHTSTIGTAVTHGCVRLPDDAIEWLYRHVPVGTPVYVY